MAAGVPGSFRGRLFPKGSMHFMYSSAALHWLTEVPREVTRKDSPAWNKGRITFAGSSDEVVKAYTNQFFKDLEAFFRARPMEVRSDGLVVAHLPCRPEGTAASESVLIHVLECLGSALRDMATEVCLYSENKKLININLNNKICSIN